MTEKLTEKITTLTQQPGVYLMKDADKKIIYVGKAGNLKKRLSSYFRPPEQLDPKTRVLVQKIADIDIILTETEPDALALESNLIKRHRPRYNVILKDGKRYPSLRLNLKHPFPRLEVVRKLKNDGSRYFGPYTSPGAVRQTLKFINKHFKLRKCKDSVFKSRTRPCINYQIGRCLAPCCLEVKPEQYEETVQEVTLLLKGRTPELIRKIKQEMTAAAKAEAFEKAAELRDRMFALEKTLETQVTAVTDFKDRDVLALDRSYEHTVVTRMVVKSGYMIESRHFDFPPSLGTDGEVMEAFIRQFYAQGHPLPKEVLVSAIPDHPEEIGAFLSGIKNQKVSLHLPVRGEKRRLLNMALQNAQDHLKELNDAEAEAALMLARLQKRLKMDRPPKHIECVDNSTLAGSSPVAGLVVFKDGKPSKSDYRKYSLKTVDIPDDYASMSEVLRRRFKKKDAETPYPDLLMVDGGKGQLGIALTVMNELGIDGAFAVAGIAKKDEKRGETADKIYLPGRGNPVNFGREESLLFFLQQVRDETHRFAISFQRKRHRKASVGSALDNIPGVGRARKKMLVKHFGSIKKIRAATLKELEAVPGISRRLAETILESFRPKSV